MSRLSCKSAIKRKRLPDDLIHVVVTIASEAPQEDDARLLPRQFGITLIKQLVLWPRDGIERIAFAARKFIADRGHPVHLAGEMLVFGDPRIWHAFGRVVHDGDFLMASLVQRDMIEDQ